MRRASQPPADVSVRFHRTGLLSGGDTCNDYLRFHVAAVDLDVDSVNENFEESQGAYLARNDNDDSGNQTPDCYQTGPIVDEHDLFEVNLWGIPQPDSRILTLAACTFLCFVH